MPDASPVVYRQAGVLCGVRGTFFRSVMVARTATALIGSKVAGRYSAPGQPTLYLSASAAGVDAAMIAHATDGAARTVLRLHVDAADIFDLRSDEALAQIAAAPWQGALARGDEPPSWRVRRLVEAQGAVGLIDPSRQAPGLWHLVLFRWNTPGAPSVELR